MHTTRWFIIFTCLFVSMASAGEVRAAEGNAPPRVKHMIDTHIHLYDTRRKQGVPWPPKNSKVLYKPHLPDEFTSVARPAGVTGVVIVEASTWLEDNEWVLKAVANDDFYIGLVGNIDPYRQDFAKQLDRLARDKRLVGLRARNEKPIDFTDPIVLKNCRYLAKKELTLDILASGVGVDDVDRLARAVPDLHIVFDHALGYNIDGKPAPAAWLASVKRLAENKNVYCKVSGLYQRSVKQPAPREIAYYQDILDVLWEEFGESRLVYGSNWPVTKRSGDYKSFVELVNSYFSAKGPEACEKYFWKNANRVYRLNLK